MKKQVKILKNKEQRIVVSPECFKTLSYNERFVLIHNISCPELREEIRLKLDVSEKYYKSILKGIGNNDKPITGYSADVDPSFC